MTLYSSSKPGIVAKLLPRFPSSVTGEAPIVVDSANGNYNFSYSLDGIATRTSPDFANDKLLLDTAEGLRVIAAQAFVPVYGVATDTTTGLVKAGTIISVDTDGTMRIVAGSVSEASLADLSVNLSTKVTGTLPVANGGTGGADAETARTNLGLGTSATLNTGTSANNVVKLDGSAKLPAVDGSQLTGVVATANVPPGGARQTVYSGPVTTAGLPNFGGSTGSTTVTASGTIYVTAAAGFTDYLGNITNPSWTGLSTNGTMYLYIDVTSVGVCTTGSTTLAPIYQQGGTPSTTNGQHTYNAAEAKMYAGNGTTAPQVYRTFVGEVTVAGGVVTVITWYRVRRRAESLITAGVTVNTTSGTSVDFTGISPSAKRVVLNLSAVSTNGTSAMRFQMGVAGSIVSSGYAGFCAQIGASGGGGTSSSGFDSFGDGGATSSRSGAIIFQNVGGNTWSIMGGYNLGAGSFGYTLYGTVALSGPLERVRLTTVSGDTFDAGSASLFEE